MLILFSATWIVFIVAVLYVMVRNGKVYEFRDYYRELISAKLSIERKKFIDEKGIVKNYSDLDRYRDFTKTMLAMMDRHSYEKMLFSFKPLKLDRWFSEEEIKMICLIKNSIKL